MEIDISICMVVYTLFGTLIARVCHIDIVRVLCLSCH